MIGTTAACFYGFRSDLIKELVGKNIKVYVWILRVCFLGATYYGTIKTAETAWAIGDIGVGLMAWINIIGIVVTYFIYKPTIKALKDYEEQQKVLRKEEFTTWKNEFKNLLTMEINKYQTQVSTILENYNDTISEIRETTTTSIQENYENLSKEVGEIYTQVEKTIDEQIQINIRSLVEKINLANQNVESASQQLSQATSSMNTSVQEVNNLKIGRAHV